MDAEDIKQMATDVNNVASASFDSGYKNGHRDGYRDGLRAYAWWKDGVQYVGTCGITLKQALKG
ncbi:hypothetical protein LCGC14_2913250 [marine sediment metagenome]|uniref:Uncharacterized protein n=1 Tax=marine sediment metagenome TaxID=412755 RepID=A0A0F8XRD6_9ZZZZ